MTAAVAAFGAGNVLLLRNTDTTGIRRADAQSGESYPVPDVPPGSIWGIAETNGYPTVVDCAGKAVIYFPLPEFDPQTSVAKGYLLEQGTLRGANTEGCTTEGDVEALITGGSLVLRLDQYQADWTFEYGVPPNPIVVDGAAQPPWKIGPEYGPDAWDCAHDAAGPAVAPHGTFRFPYQTVGAAVDRAMGITAVANQDWRRAGYGWTVLITAGCYAETLTISVPLTLARRDDVPGSVVIGA